MRSAPFASLTSQCAQTRLDPWVCGAGLGPNVTFPQMTIYDSLRLHNVSFGLYMNSTCGLDGKPCHGARASGRSVCKRSARCALCLSVDWRTSGGSTLLRSASLHASTQARTRTIPTRRARSTLPTWRWPAWHGTRTASTRRPPSTTAQRMAPCRRSRGSSRRSKPCVR